ncbi:unnamed protein product [Clavelina lepadiformis]|uniref:Uncharacterized protein n=1 Tax=Clavelina lepadiformis TaxID=159417 RepID=A0ABP0FMM1_CLALP
MMAIEINEGDAGGVHLPDFTVNMIIHFNEAFCLGNPPVLRIHVELRIGSGPSLLGAHPTPRRGRGRKCAARRLHDNGRRTPRVGQDGRRMNVQPPRGDRIAGEENDVRFRGDIPHGDKQVDAVSAERKEVFNPLIDL